MSRYRYAPTYGRTPKEVKFARIGTLFIHLDDETVDSWFKARATGNRGPIEKAKKEYGKQIKDIVKRDLEKSGFTGVKITWSQKAGCSCGCSPGYVIKATGHKNSEAFRSFALNRLFSKSYFIRYDFESGALHRKTKKDIDDRSGSSSIFLKDFGFDVSDRKTTIAGVGYFKNIFK